VDSGSLQDFYQLAIAIASYGVALWLLLLVFQLLDVGTALLDLRGAHDFKLRGRGVRRRVTEYYWSIPVTVTLGLVLALGIDYAGRLFFEQGRIRDGLVVMFVLLLLALGGGLVIVYAITRAERPSYAALRANLLEDADLRLNPKQVEAFRAQLEDIDRKQRHIRFGPRDRARMRRIRSELNNLADDFRTVPPVGLEAVRAIRWKVVWAYLWRGNIIRVVPPLIALATLVLYNVFTLLAGEWNWAVSGLLLLGTGVSVLLALLSAKASLASKAAWHAVYLKQRADVEDLLIEIERTARKGVTGLGDRVARALQILREQQE
jgi:hypothetical protein